MKRSHPAPRRGFTLFELLVVMSLIAILLVLGLLAVEYAMNRSRYQDTAVLVKSVHSAIEEYKDERGHYPRPADEEETVVVKNETWCVGGARMLYQVLSGDGTDAIRNGDKRSTGEQASAREDSDPLAGRIYLDTIQPPSPKMRQEKREARHVGAEGEDCFYVVDAWRHPLRYRRPAPDESGPVSSGGSFSGAAFEMWSYGKLKKPAEGDEDREKWVTNWKDQ